LQNTVKKHLTNKIGFTCHSLRDVSVFSSVVTYQALEKQ